MRLNLNETVKVKLTERGKEIYRQYFSPLPDGFEQPEPRIDEDGFTEIQLWVFMEMFGEHMSMWQPNVIKPLEIVFDNEDKIVRCKDCKWFDVNRANFVEGYGYCEIYEVTNKDSHYCSYGEKNDAVSKSEILVCIDIVKNSGLGKAKSLEYIKKYVERMNAETPEKRTDKRTETHACDCISRQAAIESLDHIGSLDTEADREYARDIFENIPSVTPTEQQEHGRLIDADKLLQELFIVDEEEWTTPEIRTILKNAPPVEPPKKVVAQIKVDIDEIVERIKEEYEIKDLPVCEDAISRADNHARQGRK